MTDNHRDILAEAIQEDTPYSAKIIRAGVARCGGWIRTSEALAAMAEAAEQARAEERAKVTALSEANEAAMADELTRLAAENERLRSALVQYRDDLFYLPTGEEKLRRINMVKQLLEGK
jgi:hypothetical protein